MWRLRVRHERKLSLSVAAGVPSANVTRALTVRVPGRVRATRASNGGLFRVASVRPASEKTTWRIERPLTTARNGPRTQRPVATERGVV